MKFSNALHREDEGFYVREGHYLFETNGDLFDACPGN
jgi:hypothetical protein